LFGKWEVKVKDEVEEAPRQVMRPAFPGFVDL